MGKGWKREVGSDTSLRTFFFFFGRVLTFRTLLIYHIPKNKLMKSAKMGEYPNLNTNTISEPNCISNKCRGDTEKGIEPITAIFEYSILSAYLSAKDKKECKHLFNSS